MPQATERASFHGRRVNHSRTSPRLAELRRRRPDAKYWLEVLEATLGAVAAAGWARAVSVTPRRGDHNGHPLLDRATLTVDTDVVCRHVARLVGRARRSSRGTEPRIRRHDAIALLEAAIKDDAAAIVATGQRVGLDRVLARAVVPLVALPVLHACRTAWGPHVAPHWAHAYCPVCGAWPTLAEERGLERTRRFRCFRCGSDWHGWLGCPYCGNRGAAVASVVPAFSSDTRKVETCDRCRGYVKTVATFRACPPAEIGLLDLDTVELDGVARQRGHTRPTKPGHPIDVSIVAANGRGRAVR